MPNPRFDRISLFASNWSSNPASSCRKSYGTKPRTTQRKLSRSRRWIAMEFRANGFSPFNEAYENEFPTMGRPPGNGVPAFRFIALEQSQNIARRIKEFNEGPFRYRMNGYWFCEERDARRNNNASTTGTSSPCINDRLQDIKVMLDNFEAICRDNGDVKALPGDIPEVSLPQFALEQMKSEIEAEVEESENEATM